MPEKDKDENKKKTDREILNEVATFQENEDAFQLMVQLANGLTASEIIDDNQRAEEKEDIRNQSQNLLADSDDIAIKHYNQTLIKGYPALINQLNQLRYDMYTFGQRERTSEKTLQFLRDSMQALKMMSDADEVNRLSQITEIDGEKVKLSVNPDEVNSQLMYWNGFLDRMKNVNITTEKPFALDLEALGLEEIKNDLEQSMKSSHSEKSVKMQDTLNAFMENVNGAKRPYTKEQILGISKSLKELQDAAWAYCEYKRNENPDSGTGLDRLQIASRLLRATSAISGRVNPYVREELARAITNTPQKKVTRYEAVSPEEFERITAEENAKVVANRTLPSDTYKKYNEELTALIEKYPKDATLKELQEKSSNLLKAEAEYSAKHTRNSQIAVEKARDSFLPEVDKYITSLQTAGVKKGEEGKLELADRLRTTLITHQAMDLLNPDRDAYKRMGDGTDFVTKSAKENLEFLKSSKLFADGNTNIRPEMTPQIQESLKESAKVYKNWAETVTNGKIVSKRDGKSLEELAKFYKNLGHEISEFSQAEQSAKSFSDDYFKHFGGFKEYEKLTAKQNVLQVFGKAADLMTNPDETYENRAAAKLVFEELLEKYAGKDIADIDPHEASTYLKLLTLTGAELKKNSAACERYINGSATAKDIVDLKKTQSAVVDAHYNNTYDAEKFNIERENQYRENRVKKICCDMMDRYIKDLEFDMQKNPENLEHGEGAREKLVKILREPKRREKLYSEMSKLKEIQNMAAREVPYDTSKFSELSAKYIKGVVEANKSSKVAENAANKNAQKEASTDNKHLINQHLMV